MRGGGLVETSQVGLSETAYPSTHIEENTRKSLTVVKWAAFAYHTILYGMRTWSISQTSTI